MTFFEGDRYIPVTHLCLLNSKLIKHEHLKILEADNWLIDYSALRENGMPYNFYYFSKDYMMVLSRFGYQTRSIVTEQDFNWTTGKCNVKELKNFCRSPEWRIIIKFLRGGIYGSKSFVG